MPAPFRNISVEVTADIAKYRAGLDQAGKATARFGEQAKQGTTKASQSVGAVGTQAQKTGGLWARTTSSMSATAVAMGTAVGLSVQQIGSRLVQMGVDAVQSAVQFQTSMLNVQSLGEESTASIKHLSDAVLDMSTHLPQSANTLAEGLYDIESSGFTGAAALDVLHASASAASAGLTDTATSARAITAVLNSYGQSGADAATVSDILFQTVNVGVVSFEELAQSIGNFVPMAAAMGINLEQATGALATMTLAGLPAAEAATSLQRVMQSFIKPSEAMGATLARLHITLDDLKNPAFGLSGAMQAIAEDTGGSTVALQALFPDVRGLRGALALVNNEGKTYSRVMGTYAQATEGAGATSRALAEQMKSVSAQWQVFKNRLAAASTGALLKLFPELQDGARAFGNFLADLGDRLHSTWNNVQDVFADLVSIFRALWRGAQPVATLIGGLFGAAVIGTVHAFAAALSMVTGLLAEHPGLIKAVGMALVSWFVASKIVAVGSALSFILTTLRSIAATRGVSTLTAGIQALGFSAAGASGGVAALGASLVALAPVAIVAGAIMGVVSAFNAVQDASKKAKNEIKDNNAKAAGKGLDGLRVAYNKAAAATRDFDGTIHDGQSNIGKLGRTLQGAAQNTLPFFKNSVSDATGKLKENQKEAAKLGAKLPVMSKHYDRLSYNLGISRSEVDKLVRSDKDLNLTTATTNDVTKSVVGTLKRLSKETGFSRKQVASLLDAMSPEQLEEFTDEMNKAGDAVGDVVAKYGDLTGIKNLAFNDDLTVTPKQLQWNLVVIKNFYKERLAGAKQFSADITDAIAKGYDPSVIMKLASAGPEQAGPILRSLVEGYSGDMVQLVNSASQQMDAISAAAAEKARAMYMATHLNSDKLIQDLPKYQRIVDMAASGMKPPEIALRMKLPAAEFNKILDEFGNQSLPKLQAVADKKAPKIVPKLTTGNFDKDVAKALSILNGMDALNPSPKVALNLTQFASDKRIYDGTMDQLTATRDQMIETDADPEAIARVEVKIAQLTATRQAIVAAHGDPAAIDTTQFQLDVLAATRTSLINSHADPKYIAQVEAQMRILVRRRTAEVTAHANTSQAESDINFLIRGRTITIRADVDTGTGWSGLDQVVQQLNHRHGGIQAYAAGGISAFAGGGITRRQIIKFGEPETGGEAFVPRLGITSVRAKKILDVAAGWHGMAVVPAGQLRGGGSTTVQVHLGGIAIDASNAGSPAEVGRVVDRAMTQWVRRNPRELVAAIGGHEAKLGRAR